MKVALVGGGGFAGHHLALEMKRQGMEPVIIDSFMVNNLYALDPSDRCGRSMLDERFRLLDGARVSIVHMDARNYTMLSPLLASIRPDVIIHLAGVAHIDRANKDALTTFDHTVKTLENVLDIARHLNCRVIYFSSSTVYGEWGSREVLSEDDECHPYGIYGAAKRAGELYVTAYHKTYGLKTTIIRPCALYGPRCVSGRVLQKFIENALSGKPIVIFGDGSIREDFTFIGDFVDGVMKVVSAGNVYGETLNITGGHARSLKEAADIVVSHLPVDIHFGDPDPEKPHRGTMSITKAANLLKYAPSYTLESGLKEYIGWYRSFDAAQAKNQESPG